MSSLNVSVPANSSRERQYSRPPAVDCAASGKLAGSVPLLIGFPLAVACRTTRQFLDAIFFHELLTQRELIGRCLVLHAEHVLARAYEPFRRAMALETPVHIQRVLAAHERHSIHPAVAGHTTDSFVHVNAVVEINKSREIVHARPLNRFSGTKALAHRFQHWTVGPDLGVAVHAGFGRWNTGERAFLDRGMAIAAIDSIIADMMFVAERHRLSARHSYFGNVWGFIDGRESRHYRDQENETAENRDPRNRVGAWVKNLRHRFLQSCLYRHCVRRAQDTSSRCCRRALRFTRASASNPPRKSSSAAQRRSRYSLRIPKLSIFR